MKLYSGGRLIADNIVVADSFMSRFRGLMLRKELGPGEGLLLKNCSGIHCCFMLINIDVVYATENMSIIKCETVKPWHLGSNPKGTRHVLELAEGMADQLAADETLQIV